MNARRARHRVFRPRFGGVLHIMIVAAAMGGAFWVGFESLSTTTGKHASKAKRFDPPNRFEIEVALGRVGLDPSSMAAAGFSAEQTGTFIGAVAEFLRANIASYRSADADANSAAQDRDRLQRLVQSGRSTEQDRTNYAAALSSYASAVASRQAILDNAQAAGAQALNAGNAVAVLDAFRANHLVWDVPIQYLGDNRSQGDWVALRDAVANDRISSQLGQDPDAGCHQLILSALATEHASAATANLPNLPDIHNAWDTAIGP